MISDLRLLFRNLRTLEMTSIWRFHSFYFDFKQLWLNYRDVIQNVIIILVSNGIATYRESYNIRNSTMQMDFYSYFLSAVLDIFQFIFIYLFSYSLDLLTIMHVSFIIHAVLRRPRLLSEIRGILYRIIHTNEYIQISIGYLFIMHISIILAA